MGRVGTWGQRGRCEVGLAGKSGGQSPRCAQGPRTHTGLQLGVDVTQHVEGLLQDVPQGRVCHGAQDLQGQGQLSLQGQGALPHLGKDMGTG